MASISRLKVFARSFNFKYKPLLASFLFISTIFWEMCSRNFPKTFGISIVNNFLLKQKMMESSWSLLWEIVCNTTSSNIESFWQPFFVRFSSYTCHACRPARENPTPNFQFTKKNGYFPSLVTMPWFKVRNWKLFLCFRNVNFGQRKL